MSRPWQDQDALDEINKCEEVAGAIGTLEGNLARAEGRPCRYCYAKEVFYDRIDQPFRRWLMEIVPETDDISEVCEKLDERNPKEWGRTGRRNGFKCWETAFVGRTKEDNVLCFSRSV